MIKLIAFDLDGTITQHKTKLEDFNLEVLQALAAKYKLVMAGAGNCMRVFEQLNRFPIDVIGNYGLQYGKYNAETKTLDILRDERLPCDKEAIDAKITELRKKYGFTEFKGNNVEFHLSGCVTFPILGTAADIADKLSFDPDRSKRRAIYDEICAEFPEYEVFVGGSSSFDMAPKPYNKYYALDLYCRELGIKHDEAVFVGDDYGLGGNDESVYKSDFGFVCVDDYHDFGKCVKHLL